MRNISELIKEFISQVLEGYPSLHVDYSYDNELDEYDIWHNNHELEFDSEDFLQYVGKKADELLFQNKIYNFSFGYNHSKARELECEVKSYNIVTLQDPSYEFVQMAVECKQINYTQNHNIHVNYDFNIEFEKNDTSKDSSRERGYETIPTIDMGSILYKSNLMEVAS